MSDCSDGSPSGHHDWGSSDRYGHGWSPDRYGRGESPSRISDRGDRSHPRETGDSSSSSSSSSPVRNWSLIGMGINPREWQASTSRASHSEIERQAESSTVDAWRGAGGSGGYHGDDDGYRGGSESDSDIETTKWSFQALLGALHERASRMQEVDRALEETGQWEDSSIHQGETSRAGWPSGEGGNGGGSGDGHHNGHDGYSSSDEQHDSSDSDSDIEKKVWSIQALLGVLNERSSRMQEVDRVLDRAQASPNRAHHIFDNPEHLWDLTGLDRQGNWDLIRTTLLDKYENAKGTTTPPYEVEEKFGNYKVTVKGAVVDGTVRIADSWVNPI